MQDNPSTFTTGVIAGLLGAGTVALWFLIIDLAVGRPLYTPAALGSALFLRARSAEAVEMSTGLVAGYTVFHILSFCALGILLAMFARRAQREPALLLGGVLLFVTLEAFVIGLIAILAAWLLDRIAWWTIVIANLLAIAVMGYYLWRSHPKLRRQLRKDSLQDPDVEPRSA